MVAGWIMWLRDLNDHGSLRHRLGSHFGFVLTIGAVLATIAAFLGPFGVGRNVEIEKHGKLDLVLLLLAVACMATARFW
ncbi:MAG: hypothetical protein E6G54_02130 [Actinobacteria bacterium]|nr:MAG: hypothetical protein E6G54_02130 [Actinomycetota bacterium]